MSPYRTVSLGAGDVPSSSDEEMLLEQATSRSSWSRRRALATVLGSLALIGCAAVVALGMRASAGPAPPVTARSLLEDPEIHRVAASNILRVGRHLLSDDEAASVQDAVAEGFTKLHRDPKFAPELDTIELSAEQKAALTHALSFHADPRVQQLGLDVAHVVADSNSKDPAVVERELLEKMGPRASEIRRLQDEVLLAPLRSAGGDDDDLHMDLSEDRLRIMSSFKSWNVEISASKPARRLSGFLSNFLEDLKKPDTVVAAGEFTTTNKPLILAEKTLGVASAITEEARVLYDVTKFTSRAFGKRKLNFPAWSETLVGGLAGATMLVSCELKAFVHSNTAEMMTCPLSLGTQGMDFMHFFLKKFAGIDKGLGKSGVETLH